MGFHILFRSILESDMASFVERHGFKITTLTPVHIASGSEGELIPTEYVIADNSMLHKINTAKLLTKLPTKYLTEFEKYSESEDLIRIREFIQSVWTKSPDLFSDCKEYEMRAGDLEHYYRNLKSENEESQFLLTPFIRSANKLYIPGSSVKGAIRTALISELTGGINDDLNEKNINKLAEMIEAETMRYSYQNKKGETKFHNIKDPFIALKISDSPTSFPTSVIKKVDVVKIKDGKFDKDEMDKVKIFAEFIEAGNEFNIEMRLDTRYFSIPHKIGRKFHFNDIINSCKAFYERQLIHERDNFFKGFDEAKNSQISKLYDDLLILNDKPDIFLLRLGKHTGRNNMSLNLINKQGKEPVSRKLINVNGQYIPVGWVQVRIFDNLFFDNG